MIVKAGDILKEKDSEWVGVVIEVVNDLQIVFQTLRTVDGTPWFTRHNRYLTDAVSIDRYFEKVNPDGLGVTELESILWGFYDE